MRLRSLAFVSLVVGGVALPAVAEAAYTTASVNLRQGPGTNYYALTSLPPGTHVHVISCQPGWCQVRTEGALGWISASYIADGPSYGGGPAYYQGPPPPPPPMVYPPGPPRRYYRHGPYMGPYPYMGPGPYMGSPPGY